MTKWFTSDLHFSHKNIVKYTNRGKDTTEEDHNAWLIGLWNNQVFPGDEVWHLGDFSFTKKYDDVVSIVRQLNGQKHFIKGNHDDRTVLERLKDDGWICNWHDYKEIKVDATPVCLFHFPIGSWHKQSHGAILLHGHCHGNYLEGKGKILDVGLDSAYNTYGEHRFFSEQDVVEYMQSREVYVADDHRNQT